MLRQIKSLPAWALYVFIGGFLTLLFTLMLATFVTVRSVVASSPIRDRGSFTGQANDGVNSGVSVPSGGPSVSNSEEIDLTEGRLTVLVMGVDDRGQDEDGPPRTDTMILLTVDLVNQRAGMVSFPRDLWVSIPSYDGVYDKVNTAYFRGEVDNYPGGGGPTLARLTLQQSLVGRPIPYYVTIDFNAFVSVIDEIGCIPITVPETIVDETYPDGEGGYETFQIEAGEHCLDGERLLKYARTRATYGGDFDRAARQQQVIYAVRDHVLSTSQLPTLISKAPDLYATVSDGVQTNLSLSEMVSLVRLAADIPEENICSAVIDNRMVELANLSDGTLILIPDRTKVNQLILDIYNGTGRCNSELAQLAGAAQAEEASISVLNGTSREGFGSEIATRLTASGMLVVNVANNVSNEQQTVIRVYTGKTATARYIARLLNVPESAVQEVNEPSDFDIQITVGGDVLP